MAQVDPYIIPLPSKLAADPELGPYFQYLQKFLHDLWTRTGAGTDLVDGAPQLSADNTFSGDNSFTGTNTFSGSVTINATLDVSDAVTLTNAFSVSGASTFTGTVDFESTVDVNDTLYVAERGAAATDRAGFGQLWVKSDSPDVLYFTDDAGTDYLLSGTVPAFKVAATQRSSTTTLADDPDLSGISLDNNVFYKVEAYIAFESASAVPDVKWAFSFSDTPQSQEYRWTSVDSTGGSSQDSGDLTDTFTLALSAGETFDLHFIGYVRTNATTGGTISFQWAQNNSDPTSTDIHIGSWVQVTKLGDA